MSGVAAPSLALVLAISASSLASVARAPAAGEGSRERSATVLWLDKEYSLHVDLKGLQPLQAPVRAILASYAMRASTGCPAGEWKGEEYRMNCDLTTALGLGAQCSDEHLSLVKSWFQGGLPALGADPVRVAEAVRKGELKSLCSTVPDTATHRRQWDVLRVRVQGDRVTVHSVLSWTGGPGTDGGRRTFDTGFQLLSDRVLVLPEGP